MERFKGLVTPQNFPINNYESYGERGAFWSVNLEKNHYPNFREFDIRSSLALKSSALLVCCIQALNLFEIISTIYYNCELHQ